MSFHTVDEIEACLDPANHPSIRDLYRIWNQRLPVVPARGGKAPAAAATAQPIAWLQSQPALMTRFAEQALRREEYMLVRDLYGEAMDYWQGQPVDLALFQSFAQLKAQYARAQVRLGSHDEARRVLEPLTTDRRLNRRERAELLLLLGDVRREEAHQQATRPAQAQTAEQALAYYEQAEREDSGLLEAAVLGAALTFVLSENEPARRAKAEQKARALLPLLEAEENKAGLSVRTQSFRAMLLCVLGRAEDAAEGYGRLKNIEGVTTSQLAEIRHRAQYMAEALGKARDFFKPAFPPLQLIVFAGHMPDQPHAPRRFPPEAIPAMREVLRRKLDEMHARVGLVSAAAGADLLFIEALLNRPGSDCHLVLPWARDEFRETSVTPFEPPDQPPIWAPLFERAYDEATTIRELGQVFQPGDDMGWDYTLEVTSGLALSTARTLRLDVQPLALWDGQASEAPGGTFCFVNLWKTKLQQQPIVVHAGHQRAAATTARLRPQPRVERETMRQEVKTMLFADIVGYSKLPEKVMRAFVDQFLHQLSEMLAASPNAPRSINTWGDALYAVFDFSHQAGKFALGLARMVRDGEARWLESGLFYEEFDPATNAKVKRPLSIRIGLHTGPVLAHYNPVVRQISFTGSHVSRAARIEPVAEPGEVYASEEFAALCEVAAEINRRNPGGAVAGGDDFVCECVGTKQLAKNYPGRFRIYRLRPRPIYAMEELARAVHEEYLSTAPSHEKTAAHCPWEELSEELRDANRAQVADIPNKLAYLGYELTPGSGLDAAQIEITPEQLEFLADREHERWMREKMRQGWTLGPRDSDPRRKLHPSLVPYHELAEDIKELDRIPVRKIRDYIAHAGFRVRRLSPSPS